MLTIEDWNHRFTLQARWTASVRRFLFQKAALSNAETILEVGCGTGAILADLCAQSPAKVTGIDINLPSLQFATSRTTDPQLVCANGFHLPFAHSSFSTACCHYFLLWVADPLLALLEMKRVTRPGGAILALAEPDYGGRIDYPSPLAEIGGFQTLALCHQSADPLIGRKLSSLFHQSGLRSIEVGVLGGQWAKPPSKEELISEWKILENDLQGMFPQARLADLKNQDQQAWQSGERILFVPTFFAFGLV
jgi:ubiquinone/menaquinone biosynthesis C-methylase UbiE